jgi:hypothetical protein
MRFGVLGRAKESISGMSTITVGPGSTGARLGVSRGRGAALVLDAGSGGLLGDGGGALVLGAGNGGLLGDGGGALVLGAGNGGLLGDGGGALVLGAGNGGLLGDGGGALVLGAGSGGLLGDRGGTLVLGAGSGGLLGDGGGTLVLGAKAERPAFTGRGAESLLLGRNRAEGDRVAVKATDSSAALWNLSSGLWAVAVSMT